MASKKLTLAQKEAKQKKPPSDVVKRGGLKKFRAAAGLKGGKSSSGEL